MTDRQSFAGARNASAEARKSCAPKFRSIEALHSREVGEVTREDAARKKTRCTGRNSHQRATDSALRLLPFQAGNPPKQFDGCLVAVRARILLICRWVSAQITIRAKTYVVALLVQLLVAVLMAVRFQLSCILLRQTARNRPSIFV
jgi:hypothetical protein